MRKYVVLTAMVACCLLATTGLLIAQAYFDEDPDAVTVPVVVEQGELRVYTPDNQTLVYNVQSGVVVQLGYHPPVSFAEAYPQMRQDYLDNPEVDPGYGEVNAKPKKVNWRLRPNGIDPETGQKRPCVKGFLCIRW